MSNELVGSLKSLNLSDPKITSNLGVELVDILYSNTKLNFDVCAFNLVEVFQHLSARVPELANLSQILVDSIEKSIGDLNSNPDLSHLDENFLYLKDLNGLLQSGEKNFYECNQQIESCLNQSIKLIMEQTASTIFTSIVIKNRQCVLSIYEIWQLSANKVIKNKIIELFNLCFSADPTTIRLLFESTNLASELCYSVQECISQSDHFSLNLSLKCLVMLLENSGNLPIQFKEFLASNEFLNVLLKIVESEADFLFVKPTESTVETNSRIGKKLATESEKFCVADRCIHFLLSLNKKFDMPDKNLILKSIFNLNATSGDTTTINNYKYLSESVLNLLNFENDPLIHYKIKGAEHARGGDNSELYFHTNSILKFLSDLFSLAQVKDSTNIFYSNDFNVLVDIIVRKLTNLTAEDQIRVDYLSLIQLLIKNSNYMRSAYRKFDLLECFNQILNEKDQHTIDQDIVRVILTENPELLY